MTRPGRGAAELLRAVGLMADGPVPWGRPVAGRGPGIYIVELPSPPATAPVDLGRVGSWLTHRPELRVDGARPTGKELAARLNRFWLPGEPVLFAAATEKSIGGRVTALYKHVPGDRQPHAEGQWLNVLFGLTPARVWWAATDAPDEALDAFLTAFADGVDPVARAALPDRDVVLPFASTRRPTGERKHHGITGQVAPAEKVPPPPPTRLTELPPADADGAEDQVAGVGTTSRVVAPPPTHAVKRRVNDGTVPDRRTAPTPVAPRKTASVSSRPAPTSAPAPGAPDGGSGGRPASAPLPATEGRGSRQRVVVPPTVMTADGVARLRAEHDELTKVKRPAVILRIRTAKEHGDLKENAEYHAAREEQSFLEGRVLAIEAILRNHVIMEAPSGATAVHMGSRVTIEDDFGTTTYTIVGPTEANPAEGRISTSSPVGAALLGHGVGQEVVVRTPRGASVFKIVTIE